MSTVIVRPYPSSSDAPSEQMIYLRILAKSSEWANKYDRLEVWRSTGGEGGPYEQLTGAHWRGARLPSTASNMPAFPVTGKSVVAVGETLELSVARGESQTITLTGTDPLTYADIAGQISASSPLIFSYVSSSGELVIETSNPGVGSLLEITGGSAAALLGLPVGEESHGISPHIGLITDVEAYAFVDDHGSGSYFYKTRYSNSFSGTQSEFSLPFTIGEAVGLDSTALICGQATLVNPDGKPAANVEVTVYSRVHVSLVDGKLVTTKELQKVTDANGHVEFNLVRGLPVTVSIGGTNIVRDIVVPEDPNLTFFQLFEEMTETDDVFTVQVPTIITAERRSL